MKQQLKALMAAATLMVPTAGAVSAMTDADVMSMGHSMLVGAIVNQLSSSGLDTSGVSKLTLNEAAQISLILRDGSESEVDKTRRIELILDRAAAR
ncbi:hypothetical protein PSA7680_02925 [Pseudoruegeria aquimaris]|uniref:Uncharacterized protein n=1 Tax=Pseudoruegeria aquimaris TaxID=393663 RepID=A0A1Y5T5T6_9RHOB|nr:hypothetical protein [Pseudoruegeria aquimaris]SLN56109.1 hypothetical protein PSA7680_02925 [Pseudoruegeria aquimaris]